MNPDCYITIKLAIAYCILAYAALKSDINNTEITCDDMAKVIYGLMEINEKNRNTITDTPIDTPSDIVIQEAEKIIDFNGLNTDFFITNRHTIAYGIIAFHTLQTSGSKNNFTCKLLAKVIVDTMKIKTPDVAIERGQKLLLDNKYL